MPYSLVKKIKIQIIKQKMSMKPQEIKEHLDYLGV